MRDLVYVVVYSNGFYKANISEAYEDRNDAANAVDKLNSIPGYFAWCVHIPIHRKEAKDE